MLQDSDSSAASSPSQGLADASADLMESLDSLLDSFQIPPTDSPHHVAAHHAGPHTLQQQSQADADIDELPAGTKKAADRGVESATDDQQQLQSGTASHYSEQKCQLVLAQGCCQEHCSDVLRSHRPGIQLSRGLCQTCMHASVCQTACLQFT